MFPAKDWRIGAFHFEEVLLDYDVAMNYGNWVVVAEAGITERLWPSNMSMAQVYHGLQCL